MHFDALTLAAVQAELAATLIPGRVQRLLMPDDQSLGLEIYAQGQRRYLLLSVHPQASRIHLVPHRLRRGAERQPPLLLLLRKFVRGARLEAIQQPQPTERILTLHFDHPEQGTATLVAEPMGRRSNLILLGPGGIVLDALRRAPAGEQARRIILPRHPYTPPPPQAKLPPLDDGRPGYYEELAHFLEAEEPLWRVLVQRLAGTSPTLAREAAWRATGHPDTPARDAPVLAVVQALQELWEPTRSGGWEPGVALDEAGQPLAFAPYRLHFLGRFQPTPGVSQAVARYFAARTAQGGQEQAASSDPYAGQRNRVAQLIRQAEKRIRRQLAALAQDEPRPGEPEELRTQAEWLLALASRIQPGQRELVVELGPEERLVIPLDLDRSPVEQAERLFRRAAKLERAARFIPRRRAKLEADQAFLAQLASDLALAGNQPEIAQVEEELRRAGFLRPERKRRPAKGGTTGGPLRFRSPEGFTILVGRNARQNERVTFGEAKGEDLWLHVRDAPGSHVVIRSGGQAVSPETVRMAARLAAYHSSQRGERAVPVAVTRRRFVSRAPGGHPGLVRIRNEETVVVPGTLPDGLEEAGG